MEYRVALLVQCHQCGQVLELDDGFRGGVCRCRQCGALLRVPMTDTHQVQKSRPAEPAALKPKSESVAADPSQHRDNPASGFSTGRPETPEISSSRQLRPESPGTITSSGAMRPVRPESPLAENAPHGSHRSLDTESSGSSAGPRASSPLGQAAHGTPAASHSHDAADHPARKWANLPVGVYAALTAGVLLVVVLIVVLAIGFLAGRTSPTGGGRMNTTTSGNAGQAEFLGIPIRGKSVVFSLDGSSANAESFNLLATLLKQTVQMLPASTHVKIAVWEPTGLQVYPAHGWLTPATAKTAFNKLLTYAAYGSTSIRKMMIRTLKLGMEQNIFTTQKIIIPSQLATSIGAAVKPKQQVDILSINGEERILKKIAKSTGGQFRFISLSSLQPPP